MSKYKENKDSFESKVKQYLEKHHIEELIRDMTNTITQIQMEDPILFMIQFLAFNHQNPKELEKHKVFVSTEGMSQPILCIQYPQMQNLIQKESFYQCKNNYTSFKNNIRKILMLANESKDQKQKSGLYAVDEDCYTKFEPIFRPYINQIYKNTPLDFQYESNKKIQEENLQNFDKFQPFVEEGFIRIKRNVRGLYFNSILRENDSKSSESLIRDQILHIYKSWYQFFQQCILQDNINSEEQKLLLSLNDKLFRKSDYSSSLCFQTYIANKKKGQRYNDWPRNRVIAISQDKQTLVWINKDDHIQIKHSKQKQQPIGELILKIIRFHQILNQDIEFAYNKQWGYLTVKPKDLGMAISGQFKLRINSSDTTKFKQNIQLTNKNINPIFQICDWKKDQTRCTLTIQKTMYINKDDLISEFNNTLLCLFQGIFQQEIKTQQILSTIDQ